MTAVEENKALLIRFLDAFARGDISAAADCFDAETYYSHTYEADLFGTWTQQRENRRAALWTDVRVDRITVWAEDDRVGHHSTFTGTHNGPFLGIPASGERVTMPILETWRIAGGKIVEHWGGFIITPKVLDRLRRASD